MCCRNSQYDINLNSYLATESYSSKEVLMQYYGNPTKPGANVPFNFGLLDVDKRTIVESIDKNINEWLKMMPENQVANWVVSILKYNASKKILNVNRIKYNNYNKYKIKYDKGTQTLPINRTLFNYHLILLQYV